MADGDVLIGPPNDAAPGFIGPPDLRSPEEIKQSNLDAIDYYNAMGRYNEVAPPSPEVQIDLNKLISQGIGAVQTIGVAAAKAATPVPPQLTLPSIPAPAKAPAAAPPPAALPPAPAPAPMMPAPPAAPPPAAAPAPLPQYQDPAPPPAAKGSNTLLYVGGGTAAAAVLLVMVLALSSSSPAVATRGK